MRQLPAAAPSISEEQLVDASSQVRGVVASRLETIWGSCAPHLEPVQLEDGSWSKPDPRFLELAVRVTDRMMRLYRLDAPGRAVEVAETPVDIREQVLSHLAELETRLGH